MKGKNKKYIGKKSRPLGYFPDGGEIDFNEFFSSITSGASGLPGAGDLFSDEDMEKKAQERADKRYDDLSGWQKFWDSGADKKTRYYEELNALQKERDELEKKMQEQKPITDTMMGMMELFDRQEQSRDAAAKRQFRNMDSYIVDAGRYPNMQDGGIIGKLNKNKIIKAMSDDQKSILARFLRNEKAQDAYYKKYIAETIQPAYDKLKGISDKFSENEIKYLIHHQGARGAKYFIENGEPLPGLKKKNKNIGKEVVTAFSKLKDDVPYEEQIAFIESSGNPQSVYTGDANSSAIGKYGILASTHFDSISNFMDSYKEADKLIDNGFILPGIPRSNNVQSANAWEQGQQGNGSNKEVRMRNTNKAADPNADAMDFLIRSGAIGPTGQSVPKSLNGFLTPMIPFYDKMSKDSEPGSKPNTNMLSQIQNMISSDWTPIGMFESGGWIRSSYKPTTKVGNETKPKYAILDSLIGIQAEKGENILLPNGDVVDTNANKRHKDMDDDQVTDFLPESSYVFSKHGRVKIKKEDADKVIVEEENLPYAVFEKGRVPKTQKLSKYVKKKEDSPADVVNRIVKDFQTLPYEDIFTQVANEANKNNRLPWLQGVILLSENEKLAKGIDNVNFSEGGVVRRSLVPKANNPLAALPALINTGFSIYQGISNATKIRNREKESLRDIGEHVDRSNSLASLGAGFATMGAIGQDPTVTYRDREVSQLETRIPQSITDYNRSRILASRPNFSGLSAREASQLQAQFDANTSDQLSNMAYQMGLQNVGLRNRALEYSDSNRNANILGRSAAQNQARLNSNRIIGTVGSIASGHTTALQNIGTNALSAKMAARGQALSAQLQNTSVFGQNMANSLALTAPLYQQNPDGKTETDSGNSTGMGYQFNPNPNPPRPYNFYDTSTWNTGYRTTPTGLPPTGSGNQYPSVGRDYWNWSPWG